MSAALDISGLSVRYGARCAVRDVSLSVAAGEAYGLVGESGCGKSTLALAVMRALPPGAQCSGRISVDGMQPASLPPAALRRLRAHRISMVYQDPVRALNPVLRVGTQLAEVFALLGRRRREGWHEARALLAAMRIGDPERILASYPHQLSGGLAQRVVLAMALAKQPALLVLDEPTTGLDAESAAAALDLVAELRRTAAVLMISHDISMIGRVCDRAGVLYAGSLVEQGPATRVLAQPRHPYTARLIQALPQGRAGDRRLPTIEGGLPDPAALPSGCVFAPRCLLAEEACRAGPPPWHQAADHGVSCVHPDAPPPPPPAAGAPAPMPGDIVLQAEHIGRSWRGLRVLPRSFCVRRGETLGLTGASGSGKSTLARMVLGLVPADAGGTIRLRGEVLDSRVTRRTRAQHRALQAVFQNPDAALNRAFTVRQILARPLVRLAGLRGAALEARLAELAAQMRLDPASLGRRPRELSGGQKQRVAIAHAIAAGPQLLVCDEPTSALDASVQAAVLDLMAELREQGLAMLLISHDAAVVRYLADRTEVVAPPERLRA